MLSKLKITCFNMVAALVATMLIPINDLSALENSNVESLVSAMQQEGLNRISTISYRSRLERVALPEGKTAPLHFEFHTIEHMDGRFFNEYFRIENGVKSDLTSAVCWNGYSFAELQHKGRLLRVGSILPRDVNPFNLTGWIGFPYEPLLFLKALPKRYLILKDFHKSPELKEKGIEVTVKLITDDEGKKSKLWQATHAKDGRQFRIWTRSDVEKSVPISRWEEWSSGQMITRCTLLESKCAEHKDVFYPYAASARLQHFKPTSSTRDGMEPKPDSEWIVSVHDVSINRAEESDFEMDPSLANEIYSVDGGVMITVPR
jgi:hypothetical protein